MAYSGMFHWYYWSISHKLSLGLYVFAYSQELPYVRYRAAKTLDGSGVTTARELVPTKLAAAVWETLDKYKTTIPNFPQTGTCELLILDRSIDQVIYFPSWIYVHIFLVIFIEYDGFACLDSSCHTWMDLWCHVPWFIRDGWE